MKKYLSAADTTIIVITFLLFTIALFSKGLTHDLLLETGVLLVSIKIIMMSYKIMTSSNAIMKELHEIKQTLNSGKKESKS
ncbi:MAG: hypothetical protein IH595_02730 [Bacteroidales bacterium]|nr:hypothetical protein [Bacteroidales bacterium]